MATEDDKNSAIQQAELTIIEFYIGVADKRIRELQSDIDNGITTGNAVFNAEAIIRAYQKRLLALRIERQKIRWLSA